jgi:hypothetical protein
LASGWAGAVYNWSDGEAPRDCKEGCEQADGQASRKECGTNYGEVRHNAAKREENQGPGGADG